MLAKKWVDNSYLKIYMMAHTNTRQESTQNCKHENDRESLSQCSHVSHNLNEVQVKSR